MDNRVFKPLVLGMGCTGIIAMASLFTGCVPAAPPPAVSLSFVPTEGADANKTIQRWNPADNTIETVLTSPIGLGVRSAQPNSSTLLYITGITVGYSGIGGYFTINPDAAAPTSKNISSFNGIDGSLSSEEPIWSPDGRRLIVNENNILYVSTPTGTRTQIGEGYNPQWSADGRRISYASSSIFSDQFKVYDLASAQNTLTFQALHTYSGVSTQWLADNRHLLVSWINSPDKLNTSFHVVDSLAGENAAATEILKAATASSPSVDPSRASDRFIVSTESNNNRTYSLAFADGRAAIALPGVANWSADGNNIVLRSDVNHDGSTDITIADDDGQTLKTVLLPAIAAPETQQFLSSDNSNFVAEFRSSAGKTEVNIVGIPAGNTLASFQLTGVYAPTPISPSPDGNRITLATESSGTTGVWVLDIAAAQKRAILLTSTPAASLKISWSPNGKALLVNDSTATYLYDSRFADQPAELLGNNLGKATWSPESTQAAFCNQDGQLCQINVLSLIDTGHVVRLLPTHTGLSFAWGVNQQAQ